MRKLIAVIAALGILGTAGVSPGFAALSFDPVVKNDDLSAAKHMKKKKKKMKAKKKKGKKMMQLAPSDLSAMAHVKKKKKKAKAKKKMSEAVIVYRIAA